MSNEDSHLLIAGLATTAIVLFAVARFIVDMLNAPRRLDPWDAAINEQLEDPETTRACHRCLTPHNPVAHFCPKCGAAVGEYNNLLPWENCFSEGEVFRNATTMRFRATPIVIGGYLLATVAVVNAFGEAALIFALLFWVRLIQNLVKQSKSEEAAVAGD